MFANIDVHDSKIKRKTKKNHESQVKATLPKLFDYGAQHLMIGWATTITLGLTKANLEPCPYQIQTTINESNKGQNTTHEPLIVIVMMLWW
jgi:hypothetical protein